MVSQMRSTTPLQMRSMVALACLALAGQHVLAQDAREHVMDTLVATGGVIPGVFTSTGEHVLAGQFGERLRLLRYTPAGVPVWATDKIFPGTDWAKATSIATDVDGAIMVGTATVSSPAPGSFSLAAPWVRIGSNGQVEQAQGWQVELPAVVATDLQPLVELLAASNGGTYMVVRSSDPLQAMLIVARFDGMGQPQWVGVLGPANGEGPWGNSSTRVAVDAAGGLQLVRHDAFQRGTHLVRLAPEGQVSEVQFLEDPDGYDLEVFDAKVDQDGGTVLIGRMMSPDLPSGGCLIHLGSDGEVRSALRYPWDIGRRLWPLQDGSYLAMDHPWSYRIALNGQITYLRYMTDDILDAELYEFVPALVGVSTDVFYMQGALRRFLLQFATQRLRPAFITHPVDAVEGCQWETSAGFLPMILAPGTFRQGQVDQPFWSLLPNTGSLVDLQVEEQPLPLRQVGAYCDAIVGLPDPVVPNASGLYIAGPLQHGAPLWLGGVSKGEVQVLDPLGRILASTPVRIGQERVQVALPPNASGPLLLRWIAADGASSGTLRVWLDRP